jgi:outer membrane protein TolC
MIRQSLNMQLGIPVQQPLVLSDRLDEYALHLPEIGITDEAYILAQQLRPDLRLVASNIRFRQEERNLVRATNFPILSAFADYGYLGSIPDNRTRVTADKDDPFTFSTENRSFFHDSYWNAAFSVGLRMQWNIFDGFQTQARVEQVSIAIRRAELDALMLREAIYLEVDQAMRNVQSAWLRIESQARNAELAEQNYQEARLRLREGTGTRLEERQASNLRDQSRLNYLTARHDFLIARAELDKALGRNVVQIQFTD